MQATHLDLLLAGRPGRHGQTRRRRRGCCQRGHTAAPRRARAWARMRRCQQAPYWPHCLLHRSHRMCMSLLLRVQGVCKQSELGWVVCAQCLCTADSARLVFVNGNGTSVG